ncbi:hypothetical protein [Mongoliitalea lutea]|uniref:Lipocalin-like domain-containing protein n=1 Tax=Mongoliitalea lutea TaxID=849756 RepID=A0A8J3G7D2_9BACT|nr:hypothetical protein [Mongoliitalea lutea]GHB50871.1 hypothetical protein GCM10008106_34670 [Mongoliitalea lutea]
MLLKIIIFAYILFNYNEDPLIGKWKMYRNETMESILTSNRFQMEDEQTQQALADTFSKVLNGSFYHFEKDTVTFTDYKNSEIIELKGLWWTNGDTLVIGQLHKMSVQKYLITKLDKSELHMRLIDPRDGVPFRNRMIFKREE